MKIKEVVGLDVSKSKIDVIIHSNQYFFQIDNKPRGFKSLVKQVAKSSLFKAENIVFILEHTGLYSDQIRLFFHKQNIPHVVVPGLAIKRSLGITRGKDDKIDARKIALYGYRLREELKLSTMPAESIIVIKKLLGLRDRLVKQRAGYKAHLKELKGRQARKNNELLFSTQESMIRELTKHINKVETEIEQIVKGDAKLNNMYQLLISIKGIGQQTAWYMIVTTEGFTRFENARQFASYCGVAPFPNRSGSSIHGKTKVSNLAYKKIKVLLDLCAKSAIQHDNELRLFYQKRVDTGNNKKSTINIIRNKLLTRMFAVIKRNTPYVDIFKYAA
jgi:transposase